MKITDKRHKRHIRIRKKIHGTNDCPRLCVFRSLKHIYVQLVDDMQNKTIMTVSTLSPELKADLKKTKNCNAAREVGKLIAQKAREKKIKKVVFDRSGYQYHGRIKELAEAARQGGLEF